MNLNNFQGQNDSKSSHIHSQEWGLGHTEESQRISSVDPSPLQGLPLGDSESRGGYSPLSHLCCSSRDFSLVSLSFARRCEGWELRILIGYFQGIQGCTEIQWAWLRLIFLGTSWSHSSLYCSTHAMSGKSLHGFLAGIRVRHETNYSCVLKYVCGFYIHPFPHCF